MTAPLAAAALLGLMVWCERRRRARRARIAAAFLGRTPSPSSLRSLLIVGAAAVVGWAVAVPPVVEAPADRDRGSTVVLAIDVSRSMTVMDGSPDRLTSAVRSAMQLVAAVEADRIGLVAFAGDASVLVPPTVDRALLSTWLESLDPEVVASEGSDLADALAASHTALGPEPTPRDAIVLLTDAEGFEQDERRDQAVDDLVAAGVPVYWLTFGTEVGGAVPGVAGAQSAAAPELAAAIATATGGRAVRPGLAGGALMIADALKPSSAGESVQESSPAGGGSIALWVALAFVLLAVELLLAQREEVWS